MKKLCVFIACCLTFFAKASSDYNYFVDLTNVQNDKISVKLTPPDMAENDAVFMFPAIVPGTYAIYNFGRFISDLKVIDKNGKEIVYTKPDVNTYNIPNAKNIAYITYQVEDSWDYELKKNEGKDDIVFEPAGTDIEAEKIFVVNTHGFFGYFKNNLDKKFVIEVKKPKGFYASSGLTTIKNGIESDIIEVFDYHRLIDSPIMYNQPDTTFVEVGGARVLVSVYSPNKKITSAYIARNISEVLDAQRKYLGGTLPVDKYAFIVYLNDKPTLSGANGALEHCYSSFYVMPEIDSSFIAQEMRNVAAHEFFHIVTPLSIHSEEIGNFDFNNPKMSKHLWLYEGLTEYNAHHMQVLYGLIDIDKFLDVMQGKMNESQGKPYNDTLPFTFMSSHVLEAKYHDQYNNVYAKGALINMCLDILLRYNSKGAYGTQNLMADLSKLYGKNKSFKDDDLFNDIEKLTSPEVRQFLDLYVAGNKKLPYKDIFTMVGFNYDEKLVRDEISIGGFSLGFNQKTNRTVIFDLDKDDAFGKKMKYKEYDEIVSFNGKSVTLDNCKEILFGFLRNAKVGDKLEVVVARKKGKNGKEKIKTLSAKVVPVTKTIANNISVNTSPSNKQVIARNAWLGLKEKQ
ncbi:MAG TPA: peptidase M61 [Bacteroidia bacterium]|nr:peptidase M61 [Bacteroidia bacterium]